MMRTMATLLLAACLLMLAAPAAHAQRGGRDSIECRSRDYGVTICEVYWNDAQLIRQTSESACIRGRSWGISNRGLWVDHGCGGVFAEAGRGGGWRPSPGWDQSFSLTCGSPNYRYNFCSIDVGRGGRVYIERQISNTPCIEGRSWGWNRAGIWVNEGCEARFTIDRRWR